MSRSIGDLKQNLEETKRHYIDWWNGHGVVLNMWEHLLLSASDRKCNGPRWFDVDYRTEYLDWYVRNVSLKADILPVANTQLGPGSLAAILGARYEGGDDTIWIHPNPDYSDDFVFDASDNNKAWKLHKDLLKSCKKKAQGHYYVGMPDLMEGLDVLAAMKGTDKVLLDLAMQPEIVENQMQRINDIYFRVFDELYDIIREGDEMAFCYFSSWAPGKMTKLQCDISTMISKDDYRRYVQPYIKEQCQKIPYSLYHLDGVGAMHHLPALLEIKELNAIQWTPGVGEPQGGNKKWWPLYKEILKGGKSVMACHLAVDEIKPLLDNIGTEGVHLEIDFNNENEIEMAMEIVEKCKCCPVASVNSQKPKEDRVTEVNLMTELDKRILVLDGAQGTTIQQYGLSEADYRGSQYKGFKYELKGCNDLLNLTNPGVCADVQRRFIRAGADIITTHTFNAQRISLAGFHVEDKVRDINIAACAIARGVASMYSTLKKPIFVAGGVGPTSKCVSLNDISREDLFDAYYEQIRALVDGGVDCILVETIFDTENALVALDAYKKTGTKMPLIMSFTIKDPKGFNMLGQDLLKFMLSLKDEPVVAVGLNCSLGAEQMIPFLRKIAANVPQRVIAFPNAGLPNKDGKYEQTPKMMQKVIWPLIDEHLVNIIGGCCGTDDTHIREIAKLVKVDDGIFISPRKKGCRMESAEYCADSNQDVPQMTDELERASLLTEAIVKGKAEDAVEATKKEIAKCIEPQDIINGQMVKAMSEIGQQFEDGIAFVPQLLMAARAMKAALEVVKPLMAGKETNSLGKIVIGTVKGDLHDIGKNLVASMLEGCGFEVINIGIDVTAEKFVDEVRKNNADIICMSALLTTTMTYMKEVIKAVEIAGLRNKIKIMVGGAPVTQEYSDEIGADGYSDNANSAVALAKKLMER